MKANAYGHGLEALAPVAVEAGADMLGICSNPEAETIRQLGLEIPLLRLRMALEAEMEESVRELDIQEQVGSQEAAAYLSSAGVRRGRPVDVHLDIDTGMGRSGFFPEQIDAIREVMSLPGISIARVMTHFPTADSGDLAQTSAQIQLFNKGIVLIHGRRCPVIGRVSLNVLTIDVTDLDCEVRLGDEVVLIGSQGDQEITFEEMADKFSSVHTEINLMAGSLNKISYT